MASRLPPLPALHAFALVAETGSLSAAASLLNITQPAVGKRIRALEAVLGLALLHRGANSATLTQDGADYARALRGAFATMEAATAELVARERPLRVHAYTTWAMRWLIPRLPRFRAAHPGIEIEVSASTSPVDFARDGVDAAIRTAPEQPAGGVHLQSLDVAPFAARVLAAQVKRQGLGGISLLGSRVRPRDWALWARATRAEIPGTPLLFESTSLAVQAALEGLGAVIVSPALVAEDVRRRRLVPLAKGAVPTGEHYWLLLPPGVPRPSALAFRDWVRAETRERAGTGRGSS